MAMVVTGYKGWMQEPCRSVLDRGYGMGVHCLCEYYVMLSKMMRKLVGK